MKLNPQKAPLYGDCVLTVQLDDEHSAEQPEEEGAEFYLIFSGSTQRHVSSTLRVSHITLQAMCPGHNVCEQVLVTLCLARPDGTVDAHSQQSFSFVQDLALNMTHFLVDSAAAQEALLLNREQDPEEAERLDERLALKRVSQPHNRTAPKAPCNTHTGVEKETVTVTDTHGANTGVDVSSFLNSCPAVSECQQPSSLLHLAASHGLQTVPSFLLQQPGGKEALRRTNTQGSTPACLAKSRGQQQLLELFPHYATFSDVQAGAKETLQVYPKGEVFEHHASVGTYTLTFLLPSEGGAEADSGGHCCLQADVKELRRLIQLHRHTKGSSIHSLQERTQGDDQAGVSQTSATREHFCQRQEKGRKHKGTPAANSAGRNKKNKKRTGKITRPAAQSSGNESRETAHRPCAATGSGTLSSRERAVATVTNDTGIQETPSPIRPALGPGVERKCTGRKAVALPTTSVVDKQEGQKREVEPLMRKLVSKTGRDAQTLRAEISVESAAGGTVTMGQEQSQDSQDSQAEQEEPSLVDTMEKSPRSNAENSPKSTSTERKGRRALRQDGGVTGSRMGSEAVGKTVWYTGENLVPDSSEISSRKEVNSQSVWYDTDTMVERNPEELKEGLREKNKCDVSSPQASGLSSPQLVKQALSAALSQAHAARKQPAQSHGPDAQRREVHGSQQEEEVRSDWKTIGEEGGREGFSNRETTSSRRISETADSEVGGEKLGSEEKPAKGRKRRRKKRGKRGGAEAKLSSSSSIESQSQSERQTESQQATSATIQSDSETGRADSQDLPASEPTWGEEADEDDAMQLPSHTEIQTHNAHGADSDATNSDCSFLAAELSQTGCLRTDWTEVTASHTGKRSELSQDGTVNVEDFNLSSVSIQSELSETHVRTVDVKEITTVATEIFDSGELDSEIPAILIQPALENVEAKAPSQNEDLTVAGTATESVIQTALVNSKCPTEGSSFPEQDTPQAVDSDKPVHSVDPTGRPVGFVESVRPTAAAFVPFDDRTDVSPLHIREGSPESTAREYLEHCLAPEMQRGQEYKEKKTHDTRECAEEGVTERSQSEGNDGGSVHAKKLPSVDEGRQNYDEELVATAVAVVTVAIASAVASIELSQHLVDSMSESQVCAGKEAVNSPSSAQETSLASEQLQNDLLITGQFTQLISRAATQADAENQPSHISSAVQAQISGESGSVETQSMRNAGGFGEGLQSTDQANCDLPASAGAPSSPTLAKEDVQEETRRNKVSTHSLPTEEDNQLKFHPKPLPEAGEVITAEEDRRDRMQTVVVLLGDSLLHSAVTDLEVSDQSPPFREPENEAVCPKEVNGQQLTSQLQTRETPERCDGRLVESRNVESEVGWNVPYLSASDSQAEASECHLQLPCQRELPAFPLSCGSAHPLTPSKPASPADSTPEESAALANVESCEILSSGNSVTAIPLEAERDTNQREEHKSVPVNAKDAAFEGLDDDTPDTVDGCEDKEKQGGEMEARKEMPTVEETSQTESAKEEERDGDSAHALQIQRESHMLYPAQPSLEHSAVDPCEETCVSLCLVHRDPEVKEVSCAELGDDVIQKPEAPPTCVGHRDIQTCVSHSSTDNASMQEAVGPSKGASSGGTSQTSVQSLASEIDRGGGQTEGAGDEEEKKDGLPETSVSTMLRASIRSSSPFRRHSWEPGRNSTAAQTDLSQCSSRTTLSGEAKQARSPLHRRSLSWCPSNLVCPDQEQIDSRSHSLDSLDVGRSVVQIQTQCASISDQEGVPAGRSSHLDSQDRGSLASLTEEEQEGDSSSFDSQTSLPASCSAVFHHPTLSKSMSMVTITQRDIQVSGFPPSKRRIGFSVSISPLLPKTRRFFSIGSSSSDEEENGGSVTSFSSYSGSLTYSISEDEPGPLQSETEGRGGPKISRTFSYIRSKMSKKSKDKDRRGESKQESKEREKPPVCPPGSTVCQHSTRRLCNKETFFCNSCGVHVSSRSTESVSVCAKNKTKQSAVPEGVPGSSVNMRSKATSSTSSLSSTSTASSSPREPWSAVTSPDDQLHVLSPRRHPGVFGPHSNLAKSISSSNIASLDDVPLKGLKLLSQSTDSLHQGSKVNASTESLTDEGTELIDSQLMEFEHDIKYLEADSWSGMVDKKFLKTLKKDEIKRQDVIYEFYQTEVHHVRTLKIMSEVYYKGLQKELQLDTQTLKKIFPLLDELGEIHTEFLSLLLDRKRAASAERQNSNNFLICSIGDVLVKQFSGCGAVRMKKTYGKFCSRHNEAVNLYKELHAKDKRFQAFIKKTMSSSVVRRLSIPECILLVTQRITKYPVLIQRILQHTRDSDGDHSFVSEALRCVKELIMAVDGKVNEQEKKRRLKEVYSRTDSKSIMRMKSGQMFAKEDLIRGRKLLHDGALQLKNSAGRLKDVHAMLLSDVLVFLQEKDQKYVFASLDQRSTVISLHNLIVREVANEERGLFLITAGTDRPEMVEVLASSKEERNTWRAIIQDAMTCMEKEEDEGIPSETEEDRKQQQNRTKEIRERLQRKDEQIICLLEEKVHIFRELGNGSVSAEDANTSVRERLLFRATPENVTKGEPVINDAVREVETLHALVGGGAGCVPVGLTGGSVGTVCLPRRAETFGGFDSHQMNSSKNGEKDEGDESLDLRRTESDSVLKKGTAASLQMLLKRNNEQLQRSVTYLHELLVSLQAVVVQQDSFIEDQRQALNSQLTTSSTTSSSSSSSSLSSTSRPPSLSEQEKHRSLERQRQEAASLQKQQAAHQEEKRKREREWELKEKALAEREERLREDEEETRRRRQELTEEMQMLQRNKEEYQREVEWLREAQRRLERDEEALRRDAQRVDVMRDQSEQLQRYRRTPSTTSEDSLRFHSTGSLDLDSKEAAEQPKEVELSSSAPAKEHFLRIGSKRMSKNFNPFSSSTSSKAQGAEKESQLPSKLLQLTKSKEKKEKKKKKGKGGKEAQTENKAGVTLDSSHESDIFFC